MSPQIEVVNLLAKEHALNTVRLYGLRQTTAQSAHRGVHRRRGRAVAPQPSLAELVVKVKCNGGFETGMGAKLLLHDVLHCWN